MMNREIAHAREHCFGQLRRLAQVEPGGQCRNLILVEPAAQIAGATEAAGDDPRDAAEGLIGARAPEHVAILRVAVEIEHQEAQAARLALRQPPAAPHPPSHDSTPNAAPGRASPALRSKSAAAAP